MKTFGEIISKVLISFKEIKENNDNLINNNIINLVILIDFYYL